MRACKRNGLTLVELVVAMAILIVLLTIMTGGVASWLRFANGQKQEMLLQQNLRFAMDTFTNDARQATVIVGAGSDGNLHLVETITLTVPSAAGPENVTYSTRQSGTSSELVRTVNGVDQFITEKIPQLVKMYFVKAGKKIYVIMVGRVTYGGSSRSVSLSSLVFARNLGE